jgi:hypothetical protein
LIAVLNGSKTGCGWVSDVAGFINEHPTQILDHLTKFVKNPGPLQIEAWNSSIKWLKESLRKLVALNPNASSFCLLMEYEIPRESRRCDVVLLCGQLVLVLELKEKSRDSRADIDQVIAYSRDLRCYHQACEVASVFPILVLSKGDREPFERDGVVVSSASDLHSIIADMAKGVQMELQLEPAAFLRADAYRPLPTLIRAARALFEGNPLPTIKRAAAATDPAVGRIAELTHEAARAKTRKLVLVNGVPGAGKTLVGLRAVHAGHLEDLAIPREDGRKTIPAVFLSGNGPLVTVLQDALKTAGGGGKTFVRSVKDYVKTYSRNHGIPPEHLLVFDEAQRAWDSSQVSDKHEGTNESEPELFIKFAERIPEWCVFVGLIGSGQEIHVGEEGGIIQWRHAIEHCGDPSNWTVHAPSNLLAAFRDVEFTVIPDEKLNLNIEIRYHLAPKVHAFVENLLEVCNLDVAKGLAKELFECGHRYLITRDLEIAKRYIRDRYANAVEARYGILASSKDKELIKHDIDNSYLTTFKLKVGPWYNNPNGEPGSCCNMSEVATEFSSQGLEVDYALLGWGTDFARINNVWSNMKASGTRGHVKDAFQLRLNVYRVLLTRGRDGTVAYVPKLNFMDETYEYLKNAGFIELDH